MAQPSWSTRGLRAAFLIVLLVLGPLAHVGCATSGPQAEPEWWDSDARTPASTVESLAAGASQVLLPIAALLAALAIAVGAFLLLAASGDG